MKYIAIHHTGGYFSNPNASTIDLTAERVNVIHKARWSNFRSSLGFYGGYNYFIDKWGKLTKYRQIGEETAAIKGHNFDTIHICLAGNFMKRIDKPTSYQINTLIRLLTELKKVYNINYNDIIPHRALSNTKCYGDHLSNYWARDLVLNQEKINLYKKLLELYRKLLDTITKSKLGGEENPDFIDFGSVRG